MSHLLLLSGRHLLLLLLSRSRRRLLILHWGGIGCRLIGLGRRRGAVGHRRLILTLALLAASRETYDQNCTKYER